ncbi:MAG: gliding motility protein GldM [Bacteroidetes bacterium]|nr:gliding motility protein GldM [Bacteroidota bacterium]
MSGGGTPRQKMINLMYLVLLALLAMNISKEVLNSFALVNNGLVKTNTTFAAKNEITYNNFELAMLNDPVKVKPYYDRALGVKKRSQEMFDYIETLKVSLVKEVENADSIEVEGKNGKDSIVRIISDVLNMKNKEDNATPTRFFMGTSDAEAEPGTRAFELKEKIKKYKEDLLTYIDTRDRANIRLGLDIANVFNHHENKEVTWENNIFYHNASIAVMCLLTKMQNDVKNGEADIINTLFNRIDVNSFKFDTLSARVNAESKIVLIGDQYRAEIFAAGFSTTANPQIWLGTYDSTTGNIKGPIDSTSVKVSKGVGTYTIAPGAEGTTEYTGIIRMKNPADPKASPRVFPFKGEYKSQKPAIVVSPDKMLVFYAGVDNPVTISVPGIPSEDLRPSMSGGSISGSKGKYTVKVSASTKEATINVSAQVKGGTNRSMGQGVKFRVKPIPPPVATVYGKRNADFIKQGELQFVKAVVPVLDNFDFDVKFQVVSFDVSMNINGLEVSESASGPSMNEKQLSLLKKAKRGNKIYIEKVRVKKPDGIVVDVPGVNLKVT